MENFKAIPEYENYEVSDLGRVRNVKFGRILKPQKDPNGYLHVVLSKKRKRKTIYIHKLVAICFLGHLPSGMTITIDHVNGIKTDNRLENLELVSMRENTIRGMAKKNTSSQFTGVCWYKPTKKWQAKIQINDKLKHLGYFTNELEAAQAYQDALKQIKN